MATNYQVSRIKGKRLKKCLSCGEWKLMVHGPGDSKTFGVCDTCRPGQGYSEDDLNKQDVGGE
jgi:hypothetical protein